MMVGFLRRTLEVRISWRNASIRACVVKKYSSSMSESESEGVGWNDDLSSESKEDIELRLLRLLRLDIEERSES